MYFIRPQFSKKEIIEDGLQKFGLVTKASRGAPSQFYYGMSSSRYAEPMDQLDTLLLLSRLNRMGAGLGLTIFVAGRFAELNGRNREELLEAEDRKVAMLQQARNLFPNLPMTVLRTNDLWYDSSYWEAVVSIMEGCEGIVDRRRNGASFREIFEKFEEPLKGIIPRKLAGMLADIPASRLYRLFEVAEAKYLREQKKVDAKIGPSAEQEYDSYIGEFMDIVQLTQPLDFKSRPKCVKPVTPYIGKEGENRIFLSDTKTRLCAKVNSLAQRASGQPLYSGGYMNVFARLSVLAVEAAASQGSLPVGLGSRLVSDGRSAICLFEKGGTERLMRYAPVVTECLWAYLLKPMQIEMKEGGE